MLAFTNTLLTPACTLVVWFALDLLRGRQVTAIGAATAIIVGCVGITPAGGFISPGWAMVLGALAALPSYAVIVLRPRTRVDETLDVLAAHGVAGFTGILFIGFFAQLSWNGVSDGLLYGDAGQLGWQALAAVAAPAYAFVATFVLLRLIAPRHAAARKRARGGAGDGHRPPRRGGLRDGRGRDPRRARGRHRGRACRSPIRSRTPRRRSVQPLGQTEALEHDREPTGVGGLLGPAARSTSRSGSWSSAMTNAVTSLIFVAAKVSTLSANGR